MTMDKESKAEWICRCARNPGSEWRVQARDGDRKITLANDGIFDELVVDYWLHIEQLDARTWWMRAGDARLQVSVEDDGAVRLDVQRGFYDEVPGRTE